MAIIGVVAALTIPTVVQNYQKKQTVVKLKKMYSNLTRVHDLIKYENGGLDPFFDKTDAGLTFLTYAEKYWKPKLKVSKFCAGPWDCGYVNLPGNCPFKLLNGANYNPVISVNSRTLKLTDGTVVVFFINTYGSGANFILADLNGPNKPNIMGKDWFWLQFSKINGIYTIKPYAYNWTNYRVIKSYCSTKKDADCCQGQLCAHLIMLDGWQIKYDW